MAAELKEVTPFHDPQGRGGTSTEGPNGGGAQRNWALKQAYDYRGSLFLEKGRERNNWIGFAPHFCLTPKGLDK